MECICRLCGPRSGDEELVTKLTDEIEGIKLRKLVEMVGNFFFVIYLTIKNSY